ncbi:remorin-like [Nicotiana tomentosiformis]|uniref:remorin-like n=1 Tax=Nicotiana tomentosiformis TaxID=4098 RepID=UPI00051AFC3D|nr:remorin-like [Nicotiana tomentosiformis]
MGEEATLVVSPIASKETQENDHKNELKEEVEENALALVPLIEDNKEQISPSKPPPPAPEKAADSGIQRSTGGSKDRDAALMKVESEKRLALIKAWEDNEKTKADNKAFKKLSAVGAWESSKKATIEFELKQIEEEFERKKAEYEEKMKNKMAVIHREAEEKRALIEANRGQDFLKVEETAAKFHVTGIPKKFLGCFGR